MPLRAPERIAAALESRTGIAPSRDSGRDLREARPASFTHRGQNVPGRAAGEAVV